MVRAGGYLGDSPEDWLLGALKSKSEQDDEVPEQERGQSKAESRRSALDLSERGRSAP